MYAAFLTFRPAKCSTVPRYIAYLLWTRSRRGSADSSLRTLMTLVSPENWYTPVHVSIDVPSSEVPLERVLSQSSD